MCAELPSWGLGFVRMKKPAKPEPDPFPVSEETQGSIVAAMVNPSMRAAIRDRVRQLEQRHRDVHLCALIAYDVVPGCFGATLTMSPAYRKHTMQFYGAPTCDKLLDSIERWCAELLPGWLADSDQHDIKLKAHPFTVADVVRDAAPLWHAAGRLVHDCDNSIGYQPPKAVANWLAEHSQQFISRAVVAELYRAHLDASTRWARLIESCRAEHTRSEKVS